MTALTRRVARLRDDSSGFTLVELLVAMMVIAIGLFGLLAVQAKSIGTIALAKQRQTATGLANKVMEQMRALPYSTVTGGMLCSDLTGDPNVVVTGSGPTCSATFRPTYDATINESVLTTTGTQIAPLNPHVQPAASTKVGNVQYTVKAYVTRVNSNPAVDSGYWLSVVTTWSSNLTKGARKSTAVRSKLYSPKGCLATTTHPFSGPCQAFFYTDAGSSAGGITIQSTRPGLGIVDGLDAVTSTITFAGLSTRIQAEQVLSAQSSASTTLAELLNLAGLTTTAGGVTGTSSADTDPASGAPSSPGSATAISQVAGSTTSSAGGSSLTTTVGGSGSGSTLSTMTSAASPACPDQAGTAVANGQACSSSQITPGGTTSSVLKLNSMGAKNISLADISPSGVASRAFGARYVTAGTGHCTTTSGAGCVAAGSARSLGTAHAGGLATLGSGDKVYNASGADVTGSFSSGSPLVTVSGYADSAMSEAGISPAAATKTRTGTLSYWNGAGFSSVTLSGATNATYTVPLITGDYGATKLVISGEVAVTPAASTTTGSSPCLSAACTTKTSGGGLVVTLTYTVYSSGSVVGQFTVTLDLGSALAQATYKAAPSA